MSNSDLPEMFGFQFATAFTRSCKKIPATPPECVADCLLAWQEMRAYFDEAVSARFSSNGALIFRWREDEAVGDNGTQPRKS